MELKRLRRLTREVLDPRRPAYSLREEVLGIAQVLAGMAIFEIDPSRDIGAGETLGDAGWALSPTMAALCAQDYARTVVFLRGLHAAIDVALEGARPRRIRVLYAGCGPYALLAVPLMACLRPEEVRFELLDVHRESIESARSVVDARVSRHRTARPC